MNRKDPATKPIFRSDNGSVYILAESGGQLSHHGVTQQQIKPPCAEGNGPVERFHRKLPEGIEAHDLEDRFDSLQVIELLARPCHEVRLHTSLGYQTPVTWNRGNRDSVVKACSLKMSRIAIAASRSTGEFDNERYDFQISNLSLVTEPRILIVPLKQIRVSGFGFALCTCFMTTSFYRAI